MLLSYIIDINHDVNNLNIEDGAS